MRIGIDLIEIERVAQAAARPHFCARVFTQAERDYADGRAETLAGMFAAKEAAAKALGTGVRGFGLCDIEVTHDEFGAPTLRFYNRAAELFGGRKTSVSITHDRLSAAAVVLIEE
ncbi:MAG: holo-ACP synthase [Clostridia bacterium]|nr:holo-ACP synthase [Clostridia bacterium]